MPLLGENVEVRGPQGTGSALPTPRRRDGVQEVLGLHRERSPARAVPRLAFRPWEEGQCRGPGVGEPGVEPRPLLTSTTPAFPAEEKQTSLHPDAAHTSLQPPGPMPGLQEHTGNSSFFQMSPDPSLRGLVQ